MNLPKAEALTSGGGRMVEAIQGWQSRVWAWLNAEFDDARFYYIRFRAENGDAINQYRFGLLFETGHRVARSDYNAHKWFLRAAYQGVLEAQAKVCVYHLLGRGVPKNDEEAFKWCRKAAEQGHAPSQARLAIMYSDGIGVERNPKEAQKWRDKAATQRIPVPDTLQAQLSTC